MKINYNSNSKILTIDNQNDIVIPSTKAFLTIDKNLGEELLKHGIRLEFKNVFCLGMLNLKTKIKLIIKIIKL